MKLEAPLHAWFGESWGAPINQIQPHIETPAGEKCLFCHEPIAPHDQGYVMPFTNEAEECTRIAVHKRCQHRILGVEKED